MPFGGRGTPSLGPVRRGSGTKPARRVPRRAFLLACAVAAVGTTRPASAEPVDDHVIVVHPSTGDISLTLDDARRLLGAEQQYWPNGTPVLIVVPPKGSSSVTWMLDRILRMPEGAYRRHLMNQVFRGVLRQPISASTMDEIVQVVSSKRGAVSVLPRALVTEGTRVVPLR